MMDVAVAATIAVSGLSCYYFSAAAVIAVVLVLAAMAADAITLAADANCSIIQRKFLLR